MNFENSKLSNREEKSLRYLAIVANFWMTANRKRHLKVNSHFFKLHWSYSTSFIFKICQILAKFGVEPERTVSKFRKRKRKFLCCVHVRAREIRTFHVTVVQRRLRNVQKSVMHVQNNFAVLVAVAIVVALAPSCCDSKILLP